MNDEGVDFPPPDPERLREPFDSDEWNAPKWWVLVMAALTAAVLFWLAPDPWPAGEGTLRVAYRDTVVVDGAVRVGSTDEVEAEGNMQGELVRISLPAGIPIDEPTVGRVIVTDGGEPVRPSLDEVSVMLVLSDEREELIPVLRWDEQDQSLELSRRPPVQSGVVLGLLGLVVVLWISEAVPLFVTSLVIPVVLTVAGVAPASDALAPFFHPIIALFFGGFLMAEAMRRVRLDHLAAISIVTWAGRSPAALFAAMLGVSAFLSMWMSNTAATAVLIPIALAVTTPLGNLGYRKAVVLGIAYAATIGGVGSAIGTPANPLAIEFLETFVGRRISFADWFAFGLPMVALLLPVMGTVLWLGSRVRVDRATFGEARRASSEELERAGRLTADQLTVLAVFALVMAVWLTQTWHGINTGIVAVGGAAVLAALGKIRPSDLGRISWASLLTFGGGLALGVFLVQSGSSDWLATRLTGLAGMPSLLGIGVVATLTLFLTTVASNTATAAMMVPLAIPLAGVFGVDPVLLVVTVAIASSIDFALVIGTPPTMIAYSTHLYTAREIFRKGIGLDALGILILITAVIGLWQAMGLV